MKKCFKFQAVNRSIWITIDSIFYCETELSVFNSDKNWINTTLTCAWVHACELVSVSEFNFRFKSGESRHLKYAWVKSFSIFKSCLVYNNETAPVVIEFSLSSQTSKEQLVESSWLISPSRRISLPWSNIMRCCRLIYPSASFVRLKDNCWRLELNYLRKLLYTHMKLIWAKYDQWEKPDCDSVCSFCIPCCALVYDLIQIFSLIYYWLCNKTTDRWKLLSLVSLIILPLHVISEVHTLSSTPMTTTFMLRLSRSNMR